MGIHAHLHHGNTAGNEVITKEYKLLDSDANNPIMKKVLEEHDGSLLFHKFNGNVVHAPFKRTHVFNGYTIDEVFEKLFLHSHLLCENLSKDGYHGFDKTGIVNKLSTPSDMNSLMEATKAQNIGQDIWHKRYGMGKNFAPRFSPVSWWVYIAEDQLIHVDSTSGEITVALNASCVELGEHLRTVRLFKAKPINTTTVEVTMEFGAINTRTGVVDKDAKSIREQAFSEVHDPHWKWAVRAEEVLKR